MEAENVIKNLRSLWRADRIITEIRMRHMLTSFGLRAFAALIAVFGLVMFELSAYFALVRILDRIPAAAALSAVNLVTAALLFAISTRSPVGRELELATEIHSSALNALQVEADALKAQISGIIHHPLNLTLPMLPLIAILARSLKSSRTATNQTKTAPPS